MSDSFIWFGDRTLSSATTVGKSGFESDGNEGVLRIPYSFSITRASPSDYLESYPEHFYAVEMQLVYFTAPADGSKEKCVGRFEISDGNAEYKLLNVQVVGIKSQLKDYSNLVSALKMVLPSKQTPN